MAQIKFLVAESIVHTEKYVDVLGIKTRYLEAGSGEPMLLIHGGNFGGSCFAEDWEPVIDRLAHTYHVFAVDKVGCGFSDNPKRDEDYVIGITVQHVSEFLQTLGIGAVHLVGHSRGGYVATRVALEHPELCKTLTIVDSATLMIPPNPIYLRWDEEASRLATSREQVRHLEVSNSYSSSHIDEQYVDKMVEVFDSPKSLEARGKLAAGLQAQFSEDLVVRQRETHEWIRSGRLRNSTLVIWGFNDPSATMETTGIPCMQLILPNVPKSEMHIFTEAGHYAFREQPEGFVSCLESFVARHPA